MAVVKSPKNTKRKCLWISKNSKKVTTHNKLVISKNINFAKKYLSHINALKVKALKDLGIDTENIDLDTISLSDLGINLHDSLKDIKLYPIFLKNSSWTKSKNKYIFRRNMFSYVV